LLLIGQQGLVDFLRKGPLLPIGWMIVPILCQRRKKTSNKAPTTLSEIQLSGQSNLSRNNYTAHVINRNDKNKPTQTGINRNINKLFAL
jgi:hypothetical protein